MLENSIYSVISPEGCSSILWKNPNFVKEAAESLKLTAQDCMKLKIIDNIIFETPGGAHRYASNQYKYVKESIINNLAILKNIETGSLIINRNEKFLNITLNN